MIKLSFHNEEFKGKTYYSMKGSPAIELLNDVLLDRSPENIQEIIDFLSDIDIKSQYDCSENEIVVDCQVGSEATTLFLGAKKCFIAYMLSENINYVPIETFELLQILKVWKDFISIPQKEKD